MAGLEQNIFEFSDGRMWETFESPNRSGVPSDEDSKLTAGYPLFNLYWCDAGLLENLSIVLDKKYALTIIIHASLVLDPDYSRINTAIRTDRQTPDRDL